VILVGEKLSELPFSTDDFEFLDAVARQTAPAVENAFLYEDLAQQERLKHELELARRIQMESLPQFTPVVDGLDIAGQSVPAFEVGGDYFDYLNGGPPRFTVMVGDVSGKGTSAALYMSKLQGILRSLHAFGLGPARAVRPGQRPAVAGPRAPLVRHGPRRLLRHERAAPGADARRSPAALLLRGGGRHVHRLLPRGIGLGLSNRRMFDAELEEREIAYGRGDVFLLITDGITSA
jgi:phosphoserine phosphatase RsbU/P